MTPAVHQFHPDAIAPAPRMQAIAAWLRALGHTADLVVDRPDGRAPQGAQALASVSDHPDAVWLVHVTSGQEDLSAVLARAGRKILVVHGLAAARAGRLSLSRAMAAFDAVIATSNTARRALRDAGCRRALVLPFWPDLDAWAGLKADKATQKVIGQRPHLLAVGAPGLAGGLDDALRAAGHYRRTHHEAVRLVVLTDAPAAPAEKQALLALAKAEGLACELVENPAPAVRKAWMQQALACLSLGTAAALDGPLLEAMALDVPVVVARAGEAEEVLAGAGVLLDATAPDLVGALIDEVLSDGELKRELLNRQRRRLAELRRVEPKALLAEALASPGDATRQVDGPFETSYSLAIVNRMLAETMARQTVVSVRYGGTDGYGDYAPRGQDLADKPISRALWEAGKGRHYPDIAIRNMYPPRVADMTGMWNVVGPWGWEETRVPERFVAPFNRYLDGMAVISHFVKDALVASGCTLPIAVTSLGVTLPAGFAALAPHPLPTTKPVKFLHVSSCFPRKGVDVLIRGYFEAFTADDPVTLVIKTFPNPHNQVEAQLEAARKAHPNPPEVVLINRDMPEIELYSLYKAASCLVHTARGEGFGLPVAEAMLARVPVIASPNSGLADFCRPETAALVGFDWVPAQTHLSEPGSMWAEPRLEELVAALRAFAAEPDAPAVSARVEAAERLMKTEFSWERSVERWEAFLAELQSRRQKPRVAMVTTWASRCGVAEYAKFLADGAADRLEFSIFANEGGDRPEATPRYPVTPAWQHFRPGDLPRLAERLAVSDHDVIHVQAHFGFFELKELAAFIDRLAPIKPVLVTFHATKDVPVDQRTVSLSQIKGSLAKATALIVHQPDDLARLQGFGLGANAMIIPQGNVTYPHVEAAEVRAALGLDTRGPVIATFGFLMPHKGVKELIQAMAPLKGDFPNALFVAVCAIHTNLASHEHYGECLAEVKRLGLEKHVVLVPDFLAPEEAMTLLQAADITALPYHTTGESSSAAVRFCLAAGRPLITTRQPIFQEVASCSQQIEGPTPEAIAEAVRALLASPERCAALVTETRARVDETSWDRIGARYATLVEGLLAPEATATVPASPEPAARP